MTKSVQKPSIHTCHSKTKPIQADNQKRGYASFFSLLLLIIIPKCPFCVASYAGLLFVVFEVETAILTDYFIHTKTLLILLILGIVLYNFKGRKTYLSAFLILLSGTLLLLDVYLHIKIIPNILIYFTLFFAVWYNGNFKFFQNLITKKFFSIRR